ncbi:MAG TPA: group 1 truncated hemoglobin [Polyangia bacterium]|nr:group 1 truncated hemoglobin [Polyangia bacterium]
MKTITRLGWMWMTAALAAAVGCSSSSNNSPDGGGGTGGTGGAGGTTGTLYTKYGTAIPQVVDDAVAGVLADCSIAPYFAVVGTANHDSVARLKSCLRLQFTVLFGGPGTYPGKNDEGDMCEDMATIHAGLGIPGDVFDKFVMDFGGVLKADGVADADITTIANAVTGLKGQIVSPSPVEKTNCTDAGAGGSGGSTGTGGAGGTTATLYTKYGAAIPKVVDDAVAGLTSDCQIAPYFAVVGTTGHDSVARLKSCLRLQFTALFGGPATYPGVNDLGDTCESMAAIHAGLGIPGDAFDRFVMDFGGVLKADGVADADITTIANAVTGLKTQVVSSAPVEKTACDGGTNDAAVGQ